MAQRSILVGTHSIFEFIVCWAVESLNWSSEWMCTHRQIGQTGVEGNAITDASRHEVERDKAKEGASFSTALFPGKRPWERVCLFLRDGFSPGPLGKPKRRGIPPSPLPPGVLGARAWLDRPIKTSHWGRFSYRSQHVTVPQSGRRLSAMLLFHLPRCDAKSDQPDPGRHAYMWPRALCHCVWFVYSQLSARRTPKG